MLKRILAVTMVAVVVQTIAAFAHDAITPVPVDADWWAKRHEEKNARIAEGNVDLLMIGDSITHGWEGQGKEVWDTYYGDRNAVNLGYSGDRTQHVLWRLQNGEIDGISPKLAVIMIGTNNCADNSPEEIADGVTAIVQLLREKLPTMKILLLGIFPREVEAGALRAANTAATAIYSKLHDGEMIHFLDIGRDFLTEDGIITKKMMPDALHPEAYGYGIWAAAMEPKIANLLGEYSAETPPKGFVALFNGKDLTGWKGLVEDPIKRAAMSEAELAEKQIEADKRMRAAWTPVDGALEFSGDGDSLCTNRLYEDFEMLVDWKIKEKGDSGIYLRGSPQVQIWDTAQWPQGSGGLYNNKQNPKDPIAVADNPIGEWNRFRIKMIGEKVTVWLNEILVVDNTVLENYWNYDLPIFSSEQIELQNHGNTLWFKNVFIREIPRGDGWRSLFNGRDLTGWEQVYGGKTTTWTVANGILSTSKGGGWLSTTEEFSDFELEVEFRVPPGGNSGVFIRAPHHGNPAVEGSEIQVLDDFADEYKDLKPEQYCGSLYFATGPSRKVTRPAGEWQKFRILCVGSQLTVWHNGYKTIDTDMNDYLHTLKDHVGITRTSGYIGFQNHGSTLDYRNIRIREFR